MFVVLRHTAFPIRRHACRLARHALVVQHGAHSCHQRRFATAPRESAPVRQGERLTIRHQVLSRVEPTHVDVGRARELARVRANLEAGQG